MMLSWMRVRHAGISRRGADLARAFRSLLRHDGQLVMHDSERHRLRGGFDDDAVAFDRTRPVCPPELFDDLVRLGNLATGAQLVEVGAGTGQATLPLAERGLALTAIELGPELAEVAGAKLARFESVKVLTGSFEAWEHLGAVFDVVVTFNSLHWVDPELRYANTARGLPS